LLAWLALIVTEAVAAPSCAPYEPVRFRVDLAMVTDAIADQDIAQARARLGRIGDQLPCLTAVVDARHYAKFARYVALTHQLAQDEVGAVRWLLSARIAAPELDWNPVLFPPGHSLRTLAAASEWPAPTPLSHGLRPPRGGGVFLNGQLALDASAPAGVPYLAQAFDRDATAVDGWWQEGGTFPDDYLAKRFRDVPAPRWWNPGR